MFYFEKVNVASEYDKGKIHNVRVKDSDGDFVEVASGDLVVVKGLAQDDLYSGAFTRAIGSTTKYLNLNGFDATYPAAVTDKVLICDPSVVGTLKSGDKVYRIGNETYGNLLEAGKFGRARELRLNDVFKLGDSNFVSAPTVGKYAIATVNSPLHTASNTVPASGYCVEIIKKIVETTGAEAGFSSYLVRVVQL